MQSVPRPHGSWLRHRPLLVRRPALWAVHSPGCVQAAFWGNCFKFRCKAAIGAGERIGIEHFFPENFDIQRIATESCQQYKAIFSSAD